MDTKGERREKKKESLKKKTSDNRKSVNLIIEMIKKRSNGPNRRPSMGQDIHRGRKTEILHMSGHVLAEARALQIDLPFTKKTMETIIQIDSGIIQPSVDNVYTIVNSLENV